MTTIHTEKFKVETFGEFPRRKNSRHNTYYFEDETQATIKYLQLIADTVVASDDKNINDLITFSVYLGADFGYGIMYEHCK